MKDVLETDLGYVDKQDNPAAVGLEKHSISLGTAERTEVKRAVWEKVRVQKVLMFLVSLYLFVTAIALMKDGARGIAPLLTNWFAVNSPLNSLGFGWMFAYLILSGSPVAAAALTFFDVGAVDQLGAFAMITGSRLGANFIVLFLGFLYVLRGRNRATSLSMGLLSLSVTATTYIPAFLLGSVLLTRGTLDYVQLQSGALLNSVVDVMIEPITSVITHFLPEWGVFLVGLGIILVSFNLFDRCLPQMAVKESQLGWMSRLVYRPVVMFFLGAFITMISMSVSISLSILVPLSNRGFVRRENVIPYIMGANVTTFIDTLLAAVLLNNPEAFTIVFVEMFSVLLVSIFALVFVYRPYRKMTLNFIDWVLSSNLTLGVFMFFILLIPLLLIWL